MTSRERRLSIVLIGFIIVVGFGFFGYQFVLSPISAKTQLIDSLNNDIATREDRIDRIQKRRADLERWKKLSLPPDKVDPSKATEAVAPGKAPGDNARADLAQREYEDWLNTTLKSSGFAAADVTIIPKKPDAKSAPQLATKRPIYTRLQFTVQLQGDLASIVDFMDRFYKVHLLHQIRNLTIAKPLRPSSTATAPGGGPATPSTDLTLEMTVEALVLDTAEKRTTLFPDKPVDMPSLLTRTDTQYAMIAGKNIFYGPPPRSPSTDEGSTKYFDAAPFLRLNGITSGPSGLEATLWDTYHNWEYTITPRSLGGFYVETHYTLGGRKRADSERSGKTLALRDSDGKIIDEWMVVRIDPREVILRNDVKGKYYAFHMGDYLSARKELSKAELDALGIKPEPAKEAPKLRPYDPDDP